VFTDEFLGRRSLFELERAASFAGLKPDRRSLLAALAKEGLGSNNGQSTSTSKNPRSASADTTSRNGKGATFTESPWLTHAGMHGPNDGDNAEFAPKPRGLGWATSLTNLLATTPWPPEMGTEGGRSIIDDSNRGGGGSASGNQQPETAAQWLVAAVSAMESELLRSDGLQKWPCGSVAGSRTSPLRMALVPNCSFPHVSCFVSHDTNAGEHV